MKIKIERELLLPVLQAANNVVERRQTLPILSHVLLNAEAENIQVTATDMEVELLVEMAEKPEKTGAIALPARKMLDICRALPADSSLTLNDEAGKAKVTSGRSRFTLSCMPAREFPAIGAFETRAEIMLTTDVVADLLESTNFAMAHQDVRYYLNGLLLEIENSKIRAVATDGHRLALTDADADITVPDGLQLIIPRKGVLEIIRMMNAAGDTVRLSIGDGHAKINVNNQSLTTKLVDGRFPDYERVIPRQGDNRVIANRELLRAGLSRASILSNEKFRGIRLILSENLVTAVAHNPEQEEAREEIEVEYNGEPIEIGFNVSYLLDVLGVIRTDNVILDFIDANSSCLIRDPDDDHSRYVVMPMRL